MEAELEAFERLARFGGVGVQKPGLEKSEPDDTDDETGDDLRRRS